MPIRPQQRARAPTKAYTAHARTHTFALLVSHQGRRARGACVRALSTSLSVCCVLLVQYVTAQSQVKINYTFRLFWKSTPKTFLVDLVRDNRRARDRCDDVVMTCAFSPQTNPNKRQPRRHKLAGGEGATPNDKHTLPRLPRLRPPLVHTAKIDTAYRHHSALCGTGCNRESSAGHAPDARPSTSSRRGSCIRDRKHHASLAESPGVRAPCSSV